jgi:hypothetical protein
VSIDELRAQRWKEVQATLSDPTVSGEEGGAAED